MISTAELADLSSSISQPEVRRQHDAVFAQPGEDCVSRWEDDGGAVAHYLPDPRSAGSRTTRSHHAVLDPLIVITQLSIMSVQAICVYVTVTLVVSSKLLQAGSLSSAGRRDGQESVAHWRA